MVIELTMEQQRQLRRMAADENRSMEDVVQDAVTVWLRQVTDLEDAVRDGEASAEREGWLTTDEVFERLHAHISQRA